MSTVLTNGIIIPDNGSRNWGGDLANNWNIIDLNVGYMTDVKNRVTTLEASVAENTANIQINTSNISALQTSKQDVIEDLETIRAGASSGATAVQPSVLNNYVDLNSNQTISGVKTFSNIIINSNRDINFFGETFKFNEKNIDVIEEQGDNYIRYSDGIQICWGNFKGITTSQKTISFPKAFSTSASISVNGQSGIYVTVDSWTNSTFSVISTTSSNEVAWFLWLAIGRWK